MFRILKSLKFTTLIEYSFIAAFIAAFIAVTAMAAMHGSALPELGL